MGLFFSAPSTLKKGQGYLSDPFLIITPRLRVSHFRYLCFIICKNNSTGKQNDAVCSRKMNQQADLYFYKTMAATLSDPLFRMSTVVCNFFENIPGGIDAYLLSHILHDRPDEKCIIILRNCRKATSSKG